jgi:hypothetical protein
LEIKIERVGLMFWTVPIGRAMAEGIIRLEQGAAQSSIDVEGLKANDEREYILSLIWA